MLGGHTLPSPTTFFGCPLWLNLGLGTLSGTTPTTAAGTASISLAVPNDPNLAGLPMSLQTVTVGGGSIEFSNALDITAN